MPPVYFPPTVGGVGKTYLVGDASDPIFANVALSYVASPQTLTLTLVNPAAGSLTDPNAATDGSSYANGVFTLTGDSQTLATALESLDYSFNGGSTGFTLTINGTGSGGFDDTFTGDIEPLAGNHFAGGGIVAWSNNFPKAGLTLSHSNGDDDVVNSVDYSLANLTLDDASADINTPAIVTLQNSTGHTVAFASGYQWSSVTGDDAGLSLAGSAVAAFGDDDSVYVYQSKLSFYGVAGQHYVEHVAGFYSVIIAQSVTLDLSGDSDTIYFDAHDDLLNLSGVGPSSLSWSALYASNGVANLDDASLTIVGGGVTVNAVSGDDAVSLYQTNGVADTINGDGVTVSLNNAQAVVSGDGDAIWFVGGSSSTVTLDLMAGQSARVYGAGTINLDGAAVVCVGGGALVNFVGSGDVAYLTDTEGVWDRVQGAAGTTFVENAQVAVFGGNQVVRSAGGDDDVVSFNQSGGNWDSLYGKFKSATISSAQVNITGAVDDLYVTGTGTKVSFYPDPYGGYNVHGSNATISANGVSLSVLGGSDILFADDASLSLSDTYGAWDTVYAHSSSILFNNAQGSVLGGGNTISGTGAISLYATAGDDDNISGGGTFILNNAGANLVANNCFVRFGPGSNTANTLNYINEYSNGIDSHYHTFVFTGAFGLDTIIGFDSTDTIVLSKAQFADFQAFQSALTVQGTVLTLDADDQVTFVGLQTPSITAAQVKFV